MSLLKRLFTHGKRINDYFLNAVRVYAFIGDEPARCAALTAAKVAARKQRSWIVAYLLSMASDIKTFVQDDPAGNLIVQRLLSLKEDVEAKDWNVIDAEKEKNKLSRFDPEYLSALNSADPSVFERKHPQLF